jgi:hypothetical protein
MRQVRLRVQGGNPGGRHRRHDRHLANQGEALKPLELTMKPFAGVSVELVTISVDSGDVVERARRRRRTKKPGEAQTEQFNASYCLRHRRRLWARLVSE